MAAPKRKLIRLLCLALSLLAIFIFSHYSLSLPLPLSKSNIHSIPPAFTFKSNPQTPRFFSFTIKVLTYDRLPSLSRCLKSLAAADYSGDAVNLHVYLDHFKQPANGSDPAAVDEKLKSTARILEFLDRFDWKFGEKMVHYRTVNIGLQAQWLEAWWPGSDDEFVFVVEDDLELSPLYYKYLKGVIMNYYYNQTNFSPSIYGASLQRPRFVPGKHGNKMQLDPEARLFLYQLVGTWGQLLFPRPWKEFREWYDTHKAKGIKPFLDGMVTNGWYKKLGEKIWTPWFIKFVHAKGYFNIYTNFLNERALSISHRDVGVNYGKTVGPDSTLVTGNSLDFNLLDMKPRSSLKWYDYCFKEVHPGRVIRNLEELKHVLSSMRIKKPVYLVSLFNADEALTRNVLCHFQRLHIENYILVGPKSEFLLDLARRGYPVASTIQFYKSIRSSFPARGSNPEQNQELMVITYIMKKCLEFGYDSWLLDVRRGLLINKPSIGTAGHSSDFYASKELGAFYGKSKSTSVKLLQKILHEIVALPSQNQGKFVDVLVELLGKQGVKYKTGDEIGPVVNLENISRFNQSSLVETAKIVFWPSDRNFETIQKGLIEFGLWVIDGDLSCNAVFCHQS